MIGPGGIDIAATMTPADAVLLAGGVLASAGFTWLALRLADAVVVEIDLGVRGGWDDPAPAGADYHAADDDASVFHASGDAGETIARTSGTIGEIASPGQRA